MSELGSVIDQLAAVDLALLPDVELTDELLTLRSQIDQLEAQWTRRVGAAHRRGTYDADGAVSMGAWLQQRCRLAPGAARDRVNAAHRLDELPETVAAFAAGEIGWAHVQVIAGVATDDRRGQVIACESILVDAAARSTPAPCAASSPISGRRSTRRPPVTPATSPTSGAGSPSRPPSTGPSTSRGSSTPRAARPSSPRWSR